LDGKVEGRYRFPEGIPVGGHGDDVPIAVAPDLDLIGGEDCVHLDAGPMVLAGGTTGEGDVSAMVLMAEGHPVPYRLRTQLAEEARLHIVRDGHLVTADMVVAVEEIGKLERSVASDVPSGRSESEGEEVCGDCEIVVASS
jgi:hypothetical protein